MEKKTIYGDYILSCVGTYDEIRVNMDRLTYYLDSVY